MRILHIIYDDPGNPWLGGGGATRTYEIYSRIERTGHEVTILSGHYPGAARRETRGGLRYSRVGLSHPYPLSRVSFSMAVPAVIRQGGWDIVVEDVSPFSPVGAPLWTQRGIPTVASVQNLSGAHASAKYGPLGWGPRLVERPLLSRFRNFVVVSAGIAREIRQLVASDARVEVIPNSVDPVFFRGTTGQAPTGNYALFVGRLDVYQKGLDRLFQAFEIAAAQEPELRLIVAGGGKPSQLERLTTLAHASPFRERITLLGPVDKGEASKLMGGALCLLMPSRYEAWPLTALEAGASGIPLVGFNVTGVRDAAPQFPAGHGLLVTEGDTAGMASQIQQLAHNAKLRREVGEAGIRWAKQFTWDALARQQLQFYHTLVEENRARFGNAFTQ